MLERELIRLFCILGLEFQVHGLGLGLGLRLGFGLGLRLEFRFFLCFRVCCFGI